MPMISFGDLSQSFTLRRHNADLKTAVTRLSTEVTTGQVSDPGKHLSGDVSGLTGIDSALARLGAYSRAASDAAFFSGAMQNALSAVQEITTDLVPTLLSVTTAGNTQSVMAVSREGRQSFDTAVGLYNTRLGDRALFAGNETATTPLAASDQLLAQMETAIAGALTVQDVETALDAWFAAPTGFLTTGYLGGAAIAPLPVGADKRVQIDITAADPA
ncbi:MAG: flagellin, partial [Paracoccaceae bacterium]